MDGIEEGRKDRKEKAAEVLGDSCGFQSVCLFFVGCACYLRLECLVRSSFLTLIVRL